MTILVPLLASDDKVQASHFISSFYLGQALGAILIAPILAGLVDRLGRRFSSIAMDTAYALALTLMLLANAKGYLNTGLLFPFGAVTAALGALHRGAIGYGAIKVVSEKLQVTKLVAKFNTGIYATNLLGALISGMLFRTLGLNGCLTIAIATFLPMPFIYLKLFPKDEKMTMTASKPNLIFDLSEGFKLILSDRKLWVNSLVVSIWNISSNIFPGLVGIAFQKVYPGRSDYAAIAVSVAILAGALSFSPMERFAKRFTLNRIMLYALMPAILD